MGAWVLINGTWYYVKSLTDDKSLIGPTKNVSGTG